MTEPGPVVFDTGVAVVAFEPRHAAAFSALNIAWLERYFAVEEKGRKQIGDPYGNVDRQGWRNSHRWTHTGCRSAASRWCHMPSMSWNYLRWRLRISRKGAGLGAS